MTPGTYVLINPLSAKSDLNINFVLTMSICLEREVMRMNKMVT